MMARRCIEGTITCARCGAELLVRQDSHQTVEIKVEAAEALRDEADQRAEEALAAVFRSRPTTPAGLWAMCDLFIKREREFLDAPHLEYLEGVFSAVRAIVGEA